LHSDDVRAEPNYPIKDKTGVMFLSERMIRTPYRKKILSITLLVLEFVKIVVGVGPDILARDRLVKDLPNGIFAGKKLLPKVDEKTVIEMSLSVRSIDLEFQTGTFLVSGMMTLEWNDPRYMWLPSEYDGVESVPLPFSTVWTPEVILHNSLEEQFMFRQVAVLYHTGHIVYAIAVHTKSACAPNFSHFPWGVQVCLTLILMSTE